jgi:hypothetical protein
MARAWPWRSTGDLKHPLPAGVEICRDFCLTGSILPQDGYNIYKWLTTEGGAEPLCINSARVGIGGDSAGGQLTACIVQRLGRERFVPMPRYRILTAVGAGQMMPSWLMRPGCDARQARPAAPVTSSVPFHEA